MRVSHVPRSTPSNTVGLLHLEVAKVSLPEERGHIVRVRAMWNPAHLSAATRPEEGIAAILLSSFENRGKIPQQLLRQKPCDARILFLFSNGGIFCHCHPPCGDTLDAEMALKVFPMSPSIPKWRTRPNRTRAPKQTMPTILATRPRRHCITLILQERKRER